ncbi:unnamed protein product [Rotaria sordida]|uniref:Beta-1,4-galactosyltransferase n=1 Tax=Rotaria sordida TaxID=392033 RepID=A0A814SNS5_9BILA|nr:unnamed protein product [Rotaria sordida]CAF1387466.1 unnamed protein product [Rotaria sordida]
MRKNHHVIHLLICSIVLAPVLYYSVFQQIKANRTAIRSFLSILLYKQGSAIEKNVTQDTKNLTFLNNTSIQKESIEFNPFPDGSFSISINFTKPDPTIYNSLPICNFSTSNKNLSFYKIPVIYRLYPFSTIERHHSADLHFGGHWFRKTCQAKQRLAMIVPYRNRESHLKLFLDAMHPFLRKQQLDYTIFVINQHGHEPFNRGSLFNVGYIEAMKFYSFDCFIFHDVDLFPEDLRNIYKCGDRPRHLAVAMDKNQYRLFHSMYFGGATAFCIPDLLDCNGHPTIYWGWGGEDNDMIYRVVKKLNKTIVRYPDEIARYKMVRTFNHTAAKPNPDRWKILASNYNYSLDGLNTMNYTLHNILFYKLFTLINVTLPQEPREQILKRLNIKIR